MNLKQKEKSPLQKSIGASSGTFHFIDTEPPTHSANQKGNLQRGVAERNRRCSVHSSSELNTQKSISNNFFYSIICADTGKPASQANPDHSNDVSKDNPRLKKPIFRHRHSRCNHGAAMPHASMTKRVEKPTKLNINPSESTLRLFVAPAAKISSLS